MVCKEDRSGTEDLRGEEERDPVVSIYFEDPDISELFSRLLEVRGISTKMPACINDIQPGDRVITEPQYYSSLEQASSKNCLLVGNKNVLRDLDAVLLSRPLTEEKIESAISEFLNLS